MNGKPTLHVAIPVKDEQDYLPHTLHALINQKTDFLYHIYICVNQPDEWWSDAEKREICLNNQETIRRLAEQKIPNLTILDYASQGKGWIGKKHGVGWARKVLFDHILTFASDEDILISLDADTLFSENYLQSIGENFITHPELETLSIPYYHKLTEDDRANRAILRYELYMRNWFLNMHRIHSPYTFTAIGSAIAVKIRALRKIGGITPMKSGEDFYLIQKLRKMGPIGNYNPEPVYPASRFSDRVYFGTGPAMIKGDHGDWRSYAIYHHSLFDAIAETYNSIGQLFKEDKENSFLNFLKRQFKEEQFLTPLRNNFKELSRFERAFHEKADGLRILQYIKQKNELTNYSDEDALRDNGQLFFKEKLPDFLTSSFVLDQLTTEQLSELREIFYKNEQQIRS